MRGTCKGWSRDDVTVRAGPRSGLARDIKCEHHFSATMYMGSISDLESVSINTTAARLVAGQSFVSFPLNARQVRVSFLVLIVRAAAEGGNRSRVRSAEKRVASRPLSGQREKMDRPFRLIWSSKAMWLLSERIAMDLGVGSKLPCVCNCQNSLMGQFEFRRTE
jgi:hypothetical protein